MAIKLYIDRSGVNSLTIDTDLLQQQKELMLELEELMAESEIAKDKEAYREKISLLDGLQNLFDSIMSNDKRISNQGL